MASESPEGFSRKKRSLINPNASGTPHQMEYISIVPVSHPIVPDPSDMTAPFINDGKLDGDLPPRGWEAVSSDLRCKPCASKELGCHVSDSTKCCWRCRVRRVRCEKPAILKGKETSRINSKMPINVDEDDSEVQVISDTEVSNPRPATRSKTVAKKAPTSNLVGPVLVKELRSLTRITRRGNSRWRVLQQKCKTYLCPT